VGSNPTLNNNITLFGLAISFKENWSIIMLSLCPDNVKRECFFFFFFLFIKKSVHILTIVVKSYSFSFLDIIHKLKILVSYITS
jgi:hypothetical protein